MKTKTFSFLYYCRLQKSVNINARNAIGAGRRRRLIRPTAAALATTNATTARRRLRRPNSVAKQIAT